MPSLRCWFWYAFCGKPYEIRYERIKTSSKQGGFMPFREKERVLTSDEAIEFLKISKPAYLKYIHNGKIRAIKAGSGWRVLYSELLRFLKGGVNR
jgi:excisionase family DNA binding protein